MKRLVMAVTLLLALAAFLLLGGVSRAALGEKWVQNADGWYAPSKMAAEVKDYGIGFSDELASDKNKGWQTGDDTIAVGGAVWTYATGITGGPASLNTAPIIINGKSQPASTVAATWLSGGTAGQTYNISLTVHTVGGRTIIFPFKIQVK